jgi:hypothetical protein
MEQEYRYKVGDIVYHEYVGANGEKKKYRGRVTDVFRSGGREFVDVTFDHHQTAWPIRAELVKLAEDCPPEPGVNHVLC